MSQISENVVGKLVEEKGRQHKDRIFLTFKGEKVTYEELDSMSNRFANRFSDLGLQKGDKIAIMMVNHPNYLYVWFGSTKLGVVEVPINTAYKGDLLKHLIDNSESKLLIIDASFLERLLIIKDDLKKLNQIICHGEIDGKVAESIPIPISGMEELFEGPSDPPDVEVLPSDPAAII